ncbi:PAS domain-containing protein [Streptomyces canus]|nr:PAS domain-containing protein [Streptomyces canus]
MSPDYPFDDAATARAVIDDLGTVREWNGGAERLLGRPASEVVGHPAANLLVSDGPDTMFTPGGPRWDGTVTLRHRDGGTVSVWLLAHHSRSRDGSPGHWLVVTPLEVTASPDGPLATAALVQSPCAVAVYDERRGCAGSTTPWPR